MFATGYLPPDADASQDISSTSLKRENGINTLKFTKKITSADTKARQNMQLNLHKNILNLFILQDLNFAEDFHVMYPYSGGHLHGSFIGKHENTPFVQLEKSNLKQSKNNLNSMYLVHMLNTTYFNHEHRMNCINHNFVSTVGQATTSAEAKPPSLLLGLQKLGFNTLADMLANSGILQSLSGDADITIFAPNDDSIQKFLNDQPVTPPSTEDKDALKNLLLNHIVQGKIMSTGIEDGMKVTNLANNYLEIQANQDGVTVGGAKLGKVDMPVLNSIVHELESVISTEKLQGAPSQSENVVTASSTVGGSTEEGTKTEAFVKPAITTTTTTTTTTITKTTTTKKKGTPRTVVATTDPPAGPSLPLTEEVYSKCFEAKGCFGMPDGCVEKKACR